MAEGCSLRVSDAFVQGAPEPMRAAQRSVNVPATTVVPPFSCVRGFSEAQREAVRADRALESSSAMPRIGPAARAWHRRPRCLGHAPSRRTDLAVIERAYFRFIQPAMP
jgi:hypothetical protein